MENKKNVRWLSRVGTFRLPLSVFILTQTISFSRKVQSDRVGKYATENNNYFRILT